ncbi:ribbon-helix-helix protein, CopG family [Qipengyuania zhejiangensis]|uniref:ribbon-helix-helix protein, CopG family n=1 Tax=Qipengyuania zhejiangensis TaxID=3077782 RepID=UPI002D79F1E9|nr:ribbon-helix-helix protein, CopG family [Qipengyuania sp. Z2]
MKSKHTFRLSPEVAKQLAELAIRKRVSQAEIVETALISFLSPDGTERMEAAFSRRIDRVVRQMENVEHAVEVGNEALALFVRFWLTSNPPLPDAGAAVAQTMGKDRYDGFVQALARRLEGTDRLGR